MSSRAARGLRETIEAAASNRRTALQVQGKLVERLLISDLRHPAPKFEHEIKVIEIQRLDIYSEPAGLSP